MIIILLSRYEDAAVVFSKSQLSFEEVALKFIQVCEDYCMHVMTTHPVTLHVSRCIYCVCLVITKYLPLSVYLSVCLSVCLSLTNYLSVFLSTCLCLSVYLSVCLSISLSIFQVNKKEALKTFLHLKLDVLSQKDSTQQTMLTTWLIEMYLNELGCYKDSVQMDNYLKLQKEFHDFLCKTSLKVCRLITIHVEYMYSDMNT